MLKAPFIHKIEVNGKEYANVRYEANQTSTSTHQFGDIISNKYLLIVPKKYCNDYAELKDLLHENVNIYIPKLDVQLVVTKVNILDEMFNESHLEVSLA